MKEVWFTVQEVAQFLKLSELTIYKYIKLRQIEAVEFGGHYRILKTSLDSFIEKHKVKLPIQTKPYETKD